MADSDRVFAKHSVSLSHSGHEEPGTGDGYNSPSESDVEAMAALSDEEKYEEEDCGNSEDERPSKRQQVATAYHYTGPPAGVFFGGSLPQRNPSPPSSAEDEPTMAEDEVGAIPRTPTKRDSSSTTDRYDESASAAVKGHISVEPPIGRLWSKQRDLDRLAIKGFVMNAINKSGSKFSSWTSEQRWTFMQSKRLEKLREREADGRGSFQMWFPREFAKEDNEEKELIYLRKQFLQYLPEERPSDVLRRRASLHQDEDDEETIIKRETNDDENQASRHRHTYTDSVYNYVPRRAAAAKTQGRFREPSTPESDKAAYLSARKSNVRVPTRRNTIYDGDDDESDDERPLQQAKDKVFDFTTRGSTTTPDVVGLEWRQFWSTNDKGISTLVTPRVWKWNEKCQLVEWPPLEQILPPLDAPPAQPIKEEKKRKRADSALER
ncbi:hypothetical protein Slin14017_G015440 [Septoria linicola]|nr:hypothetical protein Slin14017_G015440 [Septoria linicola]